jgi:hypothetical protein
MVEFPFAGVDRKLRIEFALAPQFEAATGVPFFKLYQKVYERDATIHQVADILAIAFRANGTQYSRSEIVQFMGEGALLEAYIAAAFILIELTKRPDGSAPVGNQKPAVKRVPKKAASH